MVLAAGRGVRLGGPKALLAWADAGGVPAPLAAVHARQRLAADSERVLVVSRQSVAAVLRDWLPPGATVVCSGAPDPLGPAGSIAAALAAHALDGLVLLTPVDVVPAHPDTVRALRAPLEADPECLATRPVLGGRGGHPVIVRAQVLEPYRGPSPPPLRDVLRALGARRCDVAVSDRTVVVDLDTPADCAALGLGPPRFVGPRSAGSSAVRS